VDEATERAIGALAHKQGGYIGRQQLLQMGLGSDAISYRVESGRLIPEYFGVYAVGHVPRLPIDRAKGALLACGPRAALSHASATTLYGVYRWWEEPFEVTVPKVRRRRGIRTHRAGLTREDIRYHAGLRVTSPARTLLDMAPRLTDKQLKRAFNVLRLDHGLTTEQLKDVLHRFPRHPGAGCVRQVAKIRRGATRSALEAKFADFCERYGLPEPLLNHSINGHEVDAYFEDARVIVEIDGHDVHSGPVSFEGDRDRDADMLALDLPTIRVTEERLDNAPAREAERLHKILARRAA